MGLFGATFKLAIPFELEHYKLVIQTSHSNGINEMAFGEYIKNDNSTGKLTNGRSVTVIYFGH